MTARFSSQARPKDQHIVLVALVAATLLATAAAAQDDYPPGFRTQQGSAWCWAAAGQMVMAAIKPGDARDYVQPAQAERSVFGCASAPRNTCDVYNPVYAGCNRPGFPTFELFGFDAPPQETPLPWDDLAEWVKKQPVLFGWCVDGRCGGPTSRTSMGHWMVAVNTRLCVAKSPKKIVKMVVVNNPAPCCVGQVLSIPYETFAYGGAGLKFWFNYYGVKPKGAAAVSIPKPVVVDADDAFPPTADNAKVAALDTAITCLYDDTTWGDSGLLRAKAAPPKAGEVASAEPIDRRYIPLAELGALTTKEGQDYLQKKYPQPPLVIVVLTNEKRTAFFANAVLQTQDGKRQVIGFEDFEAAHRTMQRAEEAAKYGDDPISSKTVEYVVLETGLHFIVAADKDKTGQDAIVILSEIDCRKPSNDVARMSLAELIERLTVSD